MGKSGPISDAPLEGKTAKGFSGNDFCVLCGLEASRREKGGREILFLSGSSKVASEKGQAERLIK